jgi:hypothetical protein
MFFVTVVIESCAFSSVPNCRGALELLGRRIRQCTLTRVCGKGQFRMTAQMSFQAVPVLRGTVMVGGPWGRGTYYRHDHEDR